MNVVTGDLITKAEQGEFDVIVHGCNCFCAMGAGIALQIRNRYPQAYTEDCKTIKGNEEKLGLFTAVDVVSQSGHPFTIVNLYSQYTYQSIDNPCDYDAIERGFALINETFNGKHIAYPLIGAGLAGGDWNIISEIIDTQLTGQHTLVEWDQS